MKKITAAGAGAVLAVVAALSFMVPASAAPGGDPSGAASPTASPSTTASAPTAPSAEPTQTKTSEVKKTETPAPTKATEPPKKVAPAKTTEPKPVAPKTGSTETPSKYPYTKEASWTLPSGSPDPNTAGPSWPQTSGWSAASCLYGQHDLYTIKNEADQATFNHLGDDGKLTEGEDSSIFTSVKWLTPSANCGQPPAEHQTRNVVDQPNCTDHTVTTKHQERSREYVKVNGKWVAGPWTAWKTVSTSKVTTTEEQCPTHKTQCVTTVNFPRGDTVTAYGLYSTDGTGRDELVQPVQQVNTTFNVPIGEKRNGIDYLAVNYRGIRLVIKDAQGKVLLNKVIDQSKECTVLTYVPPTPPPTKPPTKPPVTTPPPTKPPVTKPPTAPPTTPSKPTSPPSTHKPSQTPTAPSRTPSKKPVPVAPHNDTPNPPLAGTGGPNALLGIGGGVAVLMGLGLIIGLRSKRA